MDALKAIGGFFVGLSQDDTFRVIMDWISVLSLGVAIRTFFLARNFKKQFVDENERTAFVVDLENICGKLQGYYDAFSGVYLYKPYMLEQARKDLNRIKSQYTFVSRQLSKKINFTYDLIVNRCYDESTIGQSEYRIKLCEEIDKLIILLKREVV